MPIGAYTKDEVRAIAEEIGLLVAKKPDSQDICFVDDNYGEFIEETTGTKIPKGNFVDPEGNVLGQHKGIIYYTVGPVSYTHLDVYKRQGLYHENGECRYSVGKS